jgi:RecA/RadA recombinase
MAKTSFLNDLVKTSGNDFASTLEDGIVSDVNGFINTGSYAFNALLSGSLWGGIADNKILALAGESATGKTYFTMGIVKKFLEDRENAVVLYFDSEQAVTSGMFRERGIDTSRVAIFPIATVEEFRHQVLKIVDKYIELPKDEQKPMLIVLDSLGMLSTSKEVNDTAEGKETKDMTRAQLVKATFRVLTLKLGKAGIPLIMTNHTYDSMGSMFPTKEMSGGQGLRYAASTIVFLSKRKDKDGTDVIGNIVHCKLYKGRLTKENKIVDVHISYDSGLNPYYGLLPIAEKHGLIKKVSNKFEFPNGTKAFEKAIYKNPEKYFTQEFMEALEPLVAKEFKYGTGRNEAGEEENETTD